MADSDATTDPESSQAETEPTEVDEKVDEKVDGEVDGEQDELAADDGDNNEEEFERLEEAYGALLEDNADSVGKSSVNRVQDAGDRYLDTMANMTAPEPSLLESLIEQWGVVELDDDLRAFGAYLIGNLDHNGRLQSTLAEVVQVYGQRITTEDSLEVLRLIQQLEPRGVGARDVRECLLLQLTKATPFRDVLTTLINGHLDELAGNRLPVIQRKTGYSVEMIKAAREVLLHLDPFPRTTFRARGHASGQSRPRGQSRRARSMVGAVGGRTAAAIAVESSLPGDDPRRRRSPDPRLPEEETRVGPVVD